MLLLPIGITEVFTGTPKNKRPPRRLSDLKEVFLGDDWKISPIRVPSTVKVYGTRMSPNFIKICINKELYKYTYGCQQKRAF
jgi:hypothetical protein